MTEQLPLAPGRPRRLDALTGVRALAALWVVTLHLSPLLFGLLPGLRFAQPFVSQGFLGIDLFFVLSGFILSFNYLERFSTGTDRRLWLHFLRLRLARIWPVHIFALHLVVVLYIAARQLNITLNTYDKVDYSLSGYLENITLTQAWFGSDLTWNAPAWTISAEWAAYLCFPLVAIVVARATSFRKACAGVVLSYAVWLLTVRALLWHAPMALDGALLRVLTEFVAGCFLFLVYSHSERSRFPIASLAAILVLAATAVVSWHESRAYVLTPLFALIVLGLAHGDKYLGSTLQRSVAVFLGEISYSLYLTHELLFSALGKILPWAAWTDVNIVLRLSIVALYLVFSIGVAVVTYRLIERPARRLLTRRSG